MRIAIYGQYKTGTTGLFYAILGGLGANTRTLFEPEGYAFEAGDESRSVLAKVILGMPGPGWSVDYGSFRPFDRHVYIVRDPRDWVVSGLLFLVQQERAVWGDDAHLEEVLALIRAKEAAPASLSASRILGRIVELGSGQSIESLTAWMAAQSRWLIDFEAGLPNAHRIRYEEFVDGQLDGLSEYLGFRVAIAPEVAPEHDHVPRTRSHGNWRDWFLPEDVARFRPVFEPYMTHYGYDDDWTVNPSPRILPEHASQYVERTARKKRRAAGL